MVLEMISVCDVSFFFIYGFEWAVRCFFKQDVTGGRWKRRKQWVVFKKLLLGEEKDRRFHGIFGSEIPFCFCLLMDSLESVRFFSRSLLSVLMFYLSNHQDANLFWFHDCRRRNDEEMGGAAYSMPTLLPSKVK